MRIFCGVCVHFIINFIVSSRPPLITFVTHSGLTCLRSVARWNNVTSLPVTVDSDEACGVAVPSVSAGGS